MPQKMIKKLHFLSALVSMALVGPAFAEPSDPSSTPAMENVQTETFYLENGDVPLDLMFINGGIFLMGSTPDEPTREMLDLPQAEEKVDSFYIGIFEVTVQQYGAVMDNFPSNDSRKPISNISWRDAQEFCKRLSDHTGWTFTLPSEAQWEYACRAGSLADYCYGGSEYRLKEYGWYYANSKPTGKLGSPREVGGKKPNRWGLHDMHGNVFEWCQDSFIDPTQQLPTDHGLRVIKGGGWMSDPNALRCAYREFFPERIASPRLGFRVVATPPTPD